MIKVEFKIEQDPEQDVSMSRMIEDMVALNEGEEQTPRKSAVLQFEEVNLKDGKVTFNCNERWDVKENLVSLIKQVEALPWVHKIIEFKRSKK